MDLFSNEKFTAVCKAEQKVVLFPVRLLECEREIERELERERRCLRDKRI